MWWILGTWPGTTRLHGTGPILITDTATVTTVLFIGTTGTAGDGAGTIRGDMAGTGMTGPGIPGDGVGVGLIRGTTEAITAHTTITTGQAPGTGLTMITIADMELTTPAEVASTREEA